MNYDLDKYGLSKEELFARVDHSSLESEKITAPRYSYWHSVFRVFFKKKINIIILVLRHHPSDDLRLSASGGI